MCYIDNYLISIVFTFVITSKKSSLFSLLKPDNKSAVGLFLLNLRWDFANFKSKLINTKTHNTDLIFNCIFVKDSLSEFHLRVKYRV